MRCKEAYTYLLASQTPGSPPAELRQHLVRCAKCRRRQMRLLFLENEIRAMPPSDPPAEARQRLLDQLEPRQAVSLPETAPEPVPSSEVTPVIGLPWRRMVLASLATAALVLVALGLGLGWFLSHLQNRSPIQPAYAADAGPKEAVVGRILESNLQLAQASSPKDRLDALTDMASVLRGEAFRLAKEGPVEDVLLVSDLYGRVLNEGVVARARSFPEDQQPELLAALSQELEQTADESDKAAQTALPGADEGLRNLAAAARAASRNLSADVPATTPPASPAWEPGRSGTMRDLLGTMVLQGLRLANEDDPLRRAECCNDVADHLVQGILLASSGGDTQRAEKLGGFLGSTMERGVGSNLGRFQPKNPQDARLEDAVRIGERSEKAVEMLEQKLQKAPAAAQPALRKALEASGNHPQQGHKGKAKKPKGLPPHLQKAVENGKMILITPNPQKKN